MWLKNFQIKPLLIMGIMFILALIVYLVLHYPATLTAGGLLSVTPPTGILLIYIGVIMRFTTWDYNRTPVFQEGTVIGLLLGGLGWVQIAVQNLTPLTYNGNLVFSIIAYVALMGSISWSVCAAQSEASSEGAGYIAGSVLRS